MFVWTASPPVTYPSMTQYGMEVSDILTIYVIIPSEYPDAGQVTIPMYVVLPKETPPGWVDVIYMGDWLGNGPYMMNSLTITSDSILTLTTPLNVLANVSIAALPLRNETIEVFLIRSNPLGIPPIIILPCNWTIVVTSMTPRQALTLPAPMGLVIASEVHYIEYGEYNYSPYEPTWGYWVLRVKYPMQNVTNLPWPVK